ncbi:MAG TPA: aminoacyl-tRNA hydrolase [Kiritimatiellia bacterium]|nr:aminoacyl-tRNA hydrolase [Kiritimatiellia bacterium]HNR94484.1 aminoacyl-tRNA hydrolase [Kiritimatiellia bacterium]HNS81054.1 aminoacyl-tRNA hydrolase [Kiritimatiellia bacterium]HPA78389.1 aminoacyl-tRNA hydrolase [Kiritimatiellia bacterium]HQQ04413.1 aminoacyl-tRNA hydrolase [Kiritimatiellia bacterium]
MKMVVGLGNPGPRYAGTRHNIGFRVLDRLAEQLGFDFRKSWFRNAHYGKVRIGDEEVIMLKPQTFMNASGRAVRGEMRRRKSAPGELLVVLDDIEIPFGSLRLRLKGGPGTHNGLKSVIEHAGSEDIPRVRVGVGRDPQAEDLAAYVLSDFPPETADDVERLVNRAADAVKCFLLEGPERAMNIFNS